MKFLTGLLGRSFAEFSVHAGAEPASEIFANMNLALGKRAVQVLRVGIDGDELHIAHLGVNHMVHGILAGTPHAHHANPGEGLYLWFNTLRHVRAMIPAPRIMQILTRLHKCFAFDTLRKGKLSAKGG